MKIKVKDLNFLPERILLARQKRKASFLYFTLGVIFMAALGVAAWLPINIARGQQAKLNAVSQEIKKMDPALQYYEELEKLNKELKNKDQALKEIEGSQQKITEVMKQINSILPRGCYVSNLELKAKEEMNIKVVTNDPVETARILVGLRKMGLFKKVELAGVPVVPFTTGKRELQFNLVFIGATENKDKDKEKSMENANTEAGKKGDNPAGKVQSLQDAINKTGNQ